VDVGEHVTAVGADSETVVLTLNSGSSSLKFALFGIDDGSERRLAEGAVEQIGQGQARTWFRRGADRTERDARCENHGAALDLAFELLAKEGLKPASVAAHRVVHGGPEHVAPALVDAALLEDLHRTVLLAPLHLPACIAGIEAIATRHPGLPQVACFDTAFHAALPEVARRLPLPDRFRDVRRYGFHGLSYEYVMSTLGADVPPRIVIAHLGNGASLVAVKNGRAIDTTMGLTPSGGIPMGTRTGDLDPGVLVYLARTHGLDSDALERLVDRESGLLAVGGTADMKTLLDRSGTDPRARLAVEMFAYAVRKAIGAFAAALGGIDLLVFTGGIGERAAAIRAEACRGLEPLGIELDADRNARDEEIISGAASRSLVRVVTTDEDLVIARHARRLLREAGHAAAARSR
jgi:acetate kinase